MEPLIARSLVSSYCNAKYIRISLDFQSIPNAESDIEYFDLVVHLRVRIVLRRY